MSIACNWVDTAFGDVSKRNHPLLTDTLTFRMPEDKKEIYATWHRFPNAFKEWVKQTGSVSRYSGPSMADFLPFDFDGEDLEAVLKSVRKFLGELEAVYEVDLSVIRVNFSGKKGFHVLLPAALFGGWKASEGLADHLKRVALKIGEPFQCDPSIYDKCRLFRVPNTVHGDTGLFKVPLSYQEITVLSVKEILEHAKEPRKVDYPDWNDCSVSESLREVFLSCAREEKKTLFQEEKELYPEKLKDGDGRDNAAFNLANKMRMAGISPPETLTILLGWNAQQTDPLPEKVLKQKIESAWRYQEEIEEGELKTVSELADDYQQFVKMLKTRRVGTGFPAIDKRIRTIAPGEVCTVIARSAVGKSLFAQNVLRNLTQTALTSLFVSLEMPGTLVFERYAMLEEKVSGETIEQMYDASSKTYEETTKKLAHRYSDQHLVYTGGATTEKLYELADAASERLERLDVVVVDYLGMIQESGKLYEAVSRVARELKTFAKKKNIALFVLCQVGRAAGESGDMALTKSSARESGAVEEAADVMLGLYRPALCKTSDTGEDLDKIIAVQILKNRKGMEGETFDFKFNKQFGEIENEGRLLSGERGV